MRQTAAKAPLIGLTGRRLEASSVADFPEPLKDCVLDTFITAYSAAVAAAGGLPVLLTPEADVGRLLERLDGVLLSGGADIAPDRYGEQPEPKLGVVEPVRDEFEIAIYEAAAARELPLLGVCRGLQLVNVAAGGTLHQHVPGHTSGKLPPHSVIHDVKVEPGSTLANIYGGADRLGVNSLHHQVVDRVADEMMVTATSEDGLVEGLEHKSLPVVAVQWHPELMLGAKQDPLFAWLIEAAQQR